MRNNYESVDVLLTYPADPMRLFDSLIPLGLASIASVLEENTYKVKVVDFNHYRGDFRKDLVQWNPKIVGIGGTTASRRGSFLTAYLTKEMAPSVPVVYGGPHASFAVRDTLAHVPAIDYIVKGEGEFPFLKLCDHVIRRQSVGPASIGGLCYRTQNDVNENPSERIDDLNILPIPNRHLFSGDYGLTLDLFNIPAHFLMTSRGCPAHCTFCSASRMFPGGVRYRNMAHVKKEIDMLLSSKPVHALKLFDSTFTANADHVFAFCEMIEQYNDIVWECEVRADTITRPMLCTMKRAGCVYINVGLETSDKEAQKKLAKNISTEQVEQCLTWCRELGIKTKVFMIFGHIGQTFDECKTDVAYIDRHRDDIDFFATTIGMRVFPGTALETMAKRERLMPADFSWASYKPPMSNMLLGEFGNAFIVNQKQLDFIKLFLVVLLLARQKTLTSGSYIVKMVFINCRICCHRFVDSFIHLGHRLARLSW